tara:strand:+ start:1032 stop:1733 length:702 start_codon:yes stop_codon:yes gene_type:complete
MYYNKYIKYKDKYNLLKNNKVGGVIVDRVNPYIKIYLDNNLNYLKILQEKISNILVIYNNIDIDNNMLSKININIKNSLYNIALKSTEKYNNLDSLISTFGMIKDKILEYNIIINQIKNYLYLDNNKFLIKFNYNLLEYKKGITSYIDIIIIEVGTRNKLINYYNDSEYITSLVLISDIMEEKKKDIYNENTKKYFEYDNKENFIQLFSYIITFYNLLKDIEYDLNIYILKNK